jgi:hypothetical protein
LISHSKQSLIRESKSNETKRRKKSKRVADLTQTIEPVEIKIETNADLIMDDKPFQSTSTVLMKP